MSTTETTAKDNAMTDNKYGLFDLVHYKDANWWVTGIWAEIGYDTVNWCYQLTKPCYSEAKAGDHGWLGGRMDVDQESRVKASAAAT